MYGEVYLQEVEAHNCEVGGEAPGRRRLAHSSSEPGAHIENKLKHLQS